MDGSGGFGATWRKGREIESADFNCAVHVHPSAVCECVNDAVVKGGGRSNTRCNIHLHDGLFEGNRSYSSTVGRS